jgi:hypothetical protein
MQKSHWKCPRCHQDLYLSNGGDYWCSACQKWHNGDKIDPMHRDYARVVIINESALERMLADGTVTRP